MPSEILIADDGSGSDTKLVIDRFAASAPIPVRHVWHEDAGFRLAAIRNKAIAAAKGDYVIQIDGDLILDRRFIEDHAACARRGYYIAGSRGVISQTLTPQLLAGRPTPLGPFRKGINNRQNALRAPWLSALYLRWGPERFVKGCNLSFWREDLIRVNGYDEHFVGWGGEDSDLASRLVNSGVRQQTLKFRAIVFHLHHGQVDRSNRARNIELWQQSIRSGRVRCELGLDQYII